MISASSCDRAGVDWHSVLALGTPHIDYDALPWLSERLAHVALRATRRGDLNGIPLAPWTTSRGAITALLGASGNQQCFEQTPHPWAELLEPQITRGLASFLSAGNFYQRAARTLSFIEAVAGPRLRATIESIRLGDVASVAAIPEAASGDGRRIDLITWLQFRDGRRLGAVVEAKVGHHVTEGQLASYEAAARDQYQLRPELTAFVVVAPALTRALAKQMRRHGNWSLLPWRVLLLRLSATLADHQCDEDDFIRFRRTLWSCTS